MAKYVRMTGTVIATGPARGSKNEKIVWLLTVALALALMAAAPKAMAQNATPKDPKGDS